jgi:hypothetical protein
MTFSLLDITLDKILYNTLERPVGRRSFMFFGFATFGMSTIVVSFQTSRIGPLLSIECTSCNTLSPTISQKFLQKTHA